MHRVIWSESRGAFIVTGENAKAKGKPGSTRTGIASAVVLALAAMTATPVMATTLVWSAANANIVNAASSAISDGIIANGNFSGSISNSGTISGSQHGIYMYYNTVTGDIVNSGTISGTYAEGIKIGFFGATSPSVLQGRIVNSGEISGLHNALYLNKAEVGGITNSGAILNAATIYTNNYYYYALDIQWSNVLESISNSGTISGDGGILLNMSSLAGITNSGLISSDKRGLAINYSTVSGRIVNNDTISSGRTGISINASNSHSSSIGGITNNGTITSSRNSAIGIYTVSNIGDISNAGTISGQSNGIIIQSHGAVSGGIHNSGLINGVSGDGIWLVDYGVGQGYTVGNINNSGTISGQNIGIELSSGSIITDGISNSGLISGGAAAITSLSATVLPNIVNSGEIRGLLNILSATNVTNSGTIAIPVGQSTINGNYAQTGTGIFQIDAASDTSYGKLAVSGTANIAGIVNVNLTSSMAAGQTLTGVIASSGLSGNFSRVIDNSALVNFTSTASGNNINLLSVDSGACTGSNSAAISVSCLIGFDAPSINNTGTISAGANIGIEALAGNYAGSITNSGSISGKTGVLIDAGANISGGITSSGLITGSSAGILVDATGTITGQTGILIHSGGSVSGGITNSGTIAASETAIKIISSSNVSGGISNSGTISGTYGIRSRTYSTLDDITNSGLIAGVSNGISFSRSTIAGGITNSGKISGGSGAGISVSSSTMAGGIINSGTISGSGSGIRIASSTVSGGISNSGTITGGYCGIALNNSTVAGGIVNNGTLSGGNTGVLLMYSMVSGGISNSGTILAANNSGLYIRGSTISDIANSGTISGGSEGIHFRRSTLSGDISNSGLISGGNNGINFSRSTVAGGITNSGFISGGGSDGIRVSSSTMAGGIVNSGTISGGRNGIKIASNSTVSGSISNSGTISGVSNGIFIASSMVSGGITNSGMIFGGNNAIYANNSAFNNITNDAGKSIFGSNTGILVNSSSVSGGITNSGLINGNANVSIAIGNGSHIGSIVNNTTGTISGGYAGISITSSTVSGGITNSGTISGGQYAIYVDSTSALDGITITGSNTANFTGDVFAQNTPVVIASGSTFTGANAFNVQSFDIATNALFNMGTMTGVGTSTGAISNPGVTVGNGSGTFTNAGTLSVAAGASTITGNYTQAATGAFQTNVTDDTTYGKLQVSGTATLPANAKINVNVASPNFVFTTAKTDGLTGVISAGSLIATTFDVTSNSVLVEFTGSKNANQLDLTLAVLKPAMIIVENVNTAGNTPATGAATQLDALYKSTGTGNTVMDDVINKLVTYSAATPTISSQQRVSDAVSQTLPLHAGAESAAIAGSMHIVNHIVQSRQDNSQGRSSGDEFYGNKQFWLKPFGGAANQDDRSGVSGYNAKNVGLVFGADGETSSTNRIGVAFAIANSNISGNSAVAPQSSTISTYQALVYGSHSLDKDTDISLQGDIGNSANKGLRNITFMGTTAQSNYNSLSAHLGAGVARTMVMNEATSFTPSVHADYTMVRNDAYTETGAGGLNLMVNSSNVEELILSADGRITHALQDNIQLTGNLGLGYDTMAKQASITSAYAGAPTGSFTTLGMNPSPWLARGGLGVVRKLNNGVEVTARYDVEARTSGFVAQTVSVKARWAF